MSRRLQTSCRVEGARVREEADARPWFLPKGLQERGFGKSSSWLDCQGAEDEHEHRLREGFTIRDSRRGYDNRAQPHECSHTEGRGHTQHEHRAREFTLRKRRV